MQPKERPILFSGPMVRAILDGRKTMTRRVVKPQHEFAPSMRTGKACWENSPFGEPGDTLWVRETFALYGMEAAPEHERPRFYRADDDAKPGYATPPDITWKPSIHMPRWASRITLKITDVRVERLQEITEADAKAEGCPPHIEPKWWQGYHRDDPLLHQCAQDDGTGTPPGWLIEVKPYRDLSHMNRSSKVEFRNLWDSLNSKRGFGWTVNPWVWVLTFQPLRPPNGRDGAGVVHQIEKATQ